MAKDVKPPPLKTTPTELPLVESLGWCRLDKGWVVVSLTTQGDRVVDREVLCEPMSLANARLELQVQVVRRLISPRARASA
jgi:hypothetical protein